MVGGARQRRHVQRPRVVAVNHVTGLAERDQVRWCHLASFPQHRLVATSSPDPAISVPEHMQVLDALDAARTGAHVGPHRVYPP
jgi:hypothetical protein